MKLADLKSLFGKLTNVNECQKNKFNPREEIQNLLLNWRESHDYYNGMLAKIADELNNLTAIAMPDPTQEQWETYSELMGAWDLLYSFRRANIEVFGINIARLHYDHGIGLEDLHQIMTDVFDGMGIPAEYWKGEQFEPHALVAQMVQFEGEQRHIATFIDDKTYEEAARAVGEVMGEGGITKAQAIHTVSVIRRCYESHEEAKRLLAKQQEAMQTLKDLILQQVNGATVH